MYILAGIIEDVKQDIRKCDSCQSTRPNQQKEPVMPHDVPTDPWEKAGICIFKHKHHNYLLVADYVSKFPLVRKLSNQ